MRAISVLTVAFLAAGLTGCGDKISSAEKTLPNPAVVEAQTRFTYKGKRIPPFFLADYCGGPGADEFWTTGMGVRISTVAIEGLFSDRDGSYSGCAITEGEFVRFNLPHRSDADPQRTGWFGYKFLGTTPGGITVLEYIGSMGGSGTIPGVIFLRLEMETIGYKESGRQKRLVMRFLGEESWGDRVYRDVQLVGNALRLGPERSDMPGAMDSLQPARTILLE